ncbi:MAG: 50S ribosomal protein L30 [Saprospiraceae bacterium]|jgi:large subunit ribosomal protein L30|nr:50S ribosomal protein L30 [Saprospiraceae bacterium]
MAKIKITQVRSIIKRPRDQKDTMKALRLTKMNKTVEHEATPQILGMVNKVQHMVKVEYI